MRCSKLCIGLLILGVGGAAIFASTGNATAVYLLSLLPLLACPLMCVVMMKFGKCGSEECDSKGKPHSLSKKSHVEK